MDENGLSGIAIEVVLILLLILANGLLAMSEIAIISARKVRLQQRAKEGDEGARTALSLSEEPADFLSTVQVGITLVGVLTGAFGGAAIAQPLAELLANVPILAPYRNGLALGLVVVVITYLTLVLGELAPKRLALNNPEAVARAVAGPMKRLSRLTAPVVHLLSASTNLVLRLLGVRPSDQPPVTEEEVRQMIMQGTHAGVFEEVESDMVSAVFRLSDRRVGGVMTPRPEVVYLDIYDQPEETRRKLVESGHSRYPVVNGDLDHIEGIVLAKDLLARSLAGEPLDLAACLQMPVYVPESVPAFNVLETLKESALQMVLVIDEFGGFQGIVTPSDILEEIVGDFPVGGQPVEPEIVLRDDGSYLIDGMLPIDEFAEAFNLNRLPNEDHGYYQTLSGLVMDFLGRIPSSGDSFEWNNLRFEVVDMDGFRVDKVLIVPIEEGG